MVYTDTWPYRLGLKIAIADINEAALMQVGKELAAIVGEGSVLVIPTDVSKLEQVQALSKKVYDAWGEVRIRATSEVPSPGAWCMFRVLFSLMYTPSLFHLRHRIFLPPHLSQSSLPFAPP